MDSLPRPTERPSGEVAHVQCEASAEVFGTDRFASAATTVGPETDLAHTDKIETATHDNDNLSDHDQPNLKQAITTQSANHKIYLHHRHRKDFTRQFTPGSILRHLRSWGHHFHHEDGSDQDTEAQVEHVSSHSATVKENLWIMLTTFPYWNMAYWSGMMYSVGSAMFVIDGLWSWVPLHWPETEFSGETKYGVPLWFFFGACLYQIGGVMAYLEAVNDGSFAGAAMKRLFQGHQDIEKELLDAKLHRFFGHIVPHHHHEDEDLEDRDQETARSASTVRPPSNKENPGNMFTDVKDEVERRGGIDHGAGTTGKGQVLEYITWRWYPTWHGLRNYHIFELGYIACTIQLLGVTLYGVTSVVILPGILDSLAWWQELAAYWIPQIVASVCFLLASILFTIMAQDKWYKPKVGAVSWWIGVWAQIGSVGFLLCAIFGLYSNDHSWAEYQSSLSSTWGSFFYMLSGLFQWYEAINVNVGPVLAFPNNRTPVLLRKTLS